MTLNIFMTQGVPCFGQDDRIHDLISSDLRGNKRPVFRQLLVDEFHFSAVFKCFDPFFVWHVRGSSGEATVGRKWSQVYVAQRQKLRTGNGKSIFQKITTQHVAQGLCLIPLSIFDFGGGAYALISMAGYGALATVGGRPYRFPLSRRHFLRALHRSISAPSRGYFKSRLVLVNRR